jgi:hypothetical protein
MSKHRRPTQHRRRTGLTVAALAVAAITTLGASTPALAAKGGGGGKPGGSGSTSGSCSVNPSPVAVGADYTLTGTGLGAGTLVNVLISDSGGTTSWNLQADSSGVAAVTWHSYWSGTSNVVFNVAAHHGWTTVASCSFSVS